MARTTFLSRLRLASALAAFCVCAASAQTPAMPTPTPVPADSIPSLPAATPQTTPQATPTQPQTKPPAQPATPDPLTQPIAPPVPPATTPPVYHDPLEAPIAVPREATPVVIPRQTVASIPSEPAYDLHALVVVERPDVFGSTYIPVDSPIYPLALRLYSLGYLDTSLSQHETVDPSQPAPRPRRLRHRRHQRRQRAGPANRGLHSRAARRRKPCAKRLHPRLCLRCRVRLHPPDGHHRYRHSATATTSAKPSSTTTAAPTPRASTTSPASPRSTKRAAFRSISVASTSTPPPATATPSPSPASFPVSTPSATSSAPTIRRTPFHTAPPSPARMSSAFWKPRSPITSQGTKFPSAKRIRGWDRVSAAAWRGATTRTTSTPSASIASSPGTSPISPRCLVPFATTFSSAQCKATPGRKLPGHTPKCSSSRPRQTSSSASSAPSSGVAKVTDVDNRTVR